MCSDRFLIWTSGVVEYTLQLKFTKMTIFCHHRYHCCCYRCRFSLPAHRRIRASAPASYICPQSVLSKGKVQDLHNTLINVYVRILYHKVERGWLLGQTYQLFSLESWVSLSSWVASICCFLAWLFEWGKTQQHNNCMAISKMPWKVQDVSVCVCVFQQQQ